jgi:hypothetical protein
VTSVAGDREHECLFGRFLTNCNRHLCFNRRLDRVHASIGHITADRHPFGRYPARKHLLNLAAGNGGADMFTPIMPPTTAPTPTIPPPTIVPTIPMVGLITNPYYRPYYRLGVSIWFGF